MFWVQICSDCRHLLQWYELMYLELERSGKADASLDKLCC